MVAEFLRTRDRRSIDTAEREREGEAHSDARFHDMSANLEYEYDEF